MDKLAALVSDANVLIDIIKADIDVLRKAAEIYDIYIPYVVLDEIEQLSEGKAVSLGLKLYEENPALIKEAFGKAGGLSMQDTVCFETAKKEGYACLTNDKRLHAKCEAEGISSIWGLRLILDLVISNKISKATAKNTVIKIKETNTFIKKDVFEDFFINWEKSKCRYWHKGKVRDGPQP